LTYETSGHKASTYKQIEQYPDPKSRSPIAPQGSVLPAIIDPFIIKECNYRGLRRSILTIKAVVAATGQGDCTPQQKLR